MRHVLYPRYITDGNGKRHFVTAHELLDMHNIDDSIKVSDCEVVSGDDNLKLNRDDVWLSVSPTGFPQRIN